MCASSPLQEFYLTCREAYSFHAADVLVRVLIPIATYSVTGHRMVLDMFERIPGQPKKVKVEEQLVALACRGKLPEIQDTPEDNGGADGHRYKRSKTEAEGIPNFHAIYDSLVQGKDPEVRQQIEKIFTARHQTHGQPLDLEVAVHE